MRDKSKFHGGQLTNFFRSLAEVKLTPIEFPEPKEPEIKLTEEEIMIRRFAEK